MIAVGPTISEPLPSKPSKENITEIAVGANISEPLPSQPSKENVAAIAVGATISGPLPSKEDIAKYPDAANPDEEYKIIDPGGTERNFDPGGTAEKDIAKAEDGVKTTAAADKILYPGKDLAKPTVKPGGPTIDNMQPTVKPRGPNIDNINQ